MSAPSVVSVSAIKANAAGQTVTWPVHQTGDIGLLYVESCNGAITLSTAAGFVQVAQVGTGTADTADSTRLALYWVRCTSGNMSSPIVADAGDHTITRLVVVRGCIPTGNPWDVFSSDTQAGLDTTVEIPGLTTTVADALVIGAVANGVNLGTDQVSAYVNASLAGLSAVVGGNHTIGLGGGIDIVKGTRAVAGVVSTTTATLLNAAKQARICIALKNGTAAPAVPPAFKAAGTAVANDTGTTAVVWPTHAENDIAILIVTTSNEAISFSTAAGFAEIANSPQSFGTGGGASSIRTGIYWCRATSSSMTNPVLNDPGDHVCAQILLFSGCITSGNPVDISAGDNSGASTAVTVPGATTTTDKTLVVAVGGDTRAVNSTAQYSGWTNASLVSITEIADFHSGKGSGFGAACGVKTTAGAYNATTATLAGNVQQGRISFALKPAAGGTTAPPGDVSLPHRYWRLRKTTAAAAGPKINQVLLMRRSRPAGSGGSTAAGPAKMHPGVTHFKVCLYMNQGADASAAFDVDLLLCSLPAGYSIDLPADQVTRTVDTFVYDDGILKPDVGQTDGAGVLPLVKGIIRGTGQHNDQIVFSDLGRVFQTVPKVELKGGIVDEPRSKWGTAAQVDAGTASAAPDTTKPAYDDYSAGGVSESGFTIVARLRRQGLVSALRTIAWAGTHLLVPGDVEVISTITSAPSNDDNYTVRLGGQCRLKSKNGSVFQVIVEHAIEYTTNSGAIWSTAQYYRKVYTSTSLTYETLQYFAQFTVNMPGLTSDGTDRVRIKLLKISIIGLGAYDAANTWIAGNTGSTFGSTAGFEFVDSIDNYASKTPSAGDLVHWEASGYV